MADAIVIYLTMTGNTGHYTYGKKRGKGEPYVPGPKR